MVCLAYNTGFGRPARDGKPEIPGFLTSTVLRKHNAGDKPGAADAFRMWVKSGGRVMKGLQRRREAERALYIGREASDAIDIALKAYP
jgi:lysozyme